MGAPHMPRSKAQEKTWMLRTSALCTPKIGGFSPLLWVPPLRPPIIACQSSLHGKAVRVLRADHLMACRQKLPCGWREPVYCLRPRQGQGA
eukprot:1154313-Pelagomonas_calceolata.AAC.7